MPSTTIEDVRTIGVSVTDQEAALAFYVDALGFEKRLDAPSAPPCAGSRSPLPARPPRLP